MKVSYQWLSEWVDLSSFSGPEAVADVLTQRGLEVEGIHSLSEGLQDVITVQILDRQKHPEADRLSICTVNPGSQPYLEIVCGAQNMKKGDVVALAQMGAKLPNGLKIEKSKIRGVVSHGMLCSEEELGLKDTSDGILILPVGTPVGWKLADILGREDTILELKLTANRGDCLSHRGLARELAAHLGVSLKEPKLPTIEWTQSPIQIQRENPQDCPQFFGVSIKGIKVGPSPGWLKTRLESIGQRSINNLVDVSNYLMFEYGTPVHIYDADQISGETIFVRRGKWGESVKLLDGSDFSCSSEDLVIADSEKVLGLAGVMGGAQSEVKDTTKNIFLECAEFHPTLTRKSAFRSSRRSEASLRFEKGIDPLAPKVAMARLVDLVSRVAGGVVVGATESESKGLRSGNAVQFTGKYISDRLGCEVSNDQLKSIFKGLDCQVEVKGQGSLDFFTVTGPSYRLDLRIPEDYVEEVARTIGLNAIPAKIPALTNAPISRESEDSIARQIQLRAKKAAAQLGFYEHISFAFHSKDWIERFGMSSTVPVQNPLSEEQGYLVPSLIPGLVKAYQENERHHFGMNPLSVRLFELRPVFQKLTDAIQATSETDTGVREELMFSGLISGVELQESLKAETRAVDFYDLKSSLESWFELLGTKGLRLKAVNASDLGSYGQIFHPGQSAEWIVGKDRVGFFGRIHPRLEAELKLRQPLYVFELKFGPIQKMTPNDAVTYKAWPTFPQMERDFALLVENQVSADQLIQVGLKIGKPIAKTIKIFDTYKGTGVPEGKLSLGLRVSFWDEKRSLEETEVDQKAQALIEAWKKECGADLR